MKLPIETKNPMFGKYLYPFANEIRKMQQDITWTDEEIPVEKDVQDYRVNMPKSSLSLVTYTLLLFVEIEQKVGEIWETIAKWFPHSEIEGACTEIARMEKSVHAFFYQKMADTLNISPEDTAKDQATITVLKNKLTFLNSVMDNLSHDKPLALATVSMIEQVLLFSNFAMLKSFQANGHNLIANTIAGVNFVVADETIHGQYATLLHNTFIEESDATGILFPIESHFTNVSKLVAEVVSHEDAVIDYLFREDVEINDITAEQLKVFIRSRVNLVMGDLKLPTIYQEPEVNPIADWFYKDVNAITMHDFFSSLGSQYRRGWSTEKFSRLPLLQKDVHAKDE